MPWLRSSRFGTALALLDLMDQFRQAVDAGVEGYLLFWRLYRSCNNSSRWNSLKTYLVDACRVLGERVNACMLRPSFSSCTNLLSIVGLAMTMPNFAGAWEA